MNPNDHEHAGCGEVTQEDHGLGPYAKTIENGSFHPAYYIIGTAGVYLSQPQCDNLIMLERAAALQMAINLVAALSSSNPSALGQEEAAPGVAGIWSRPEYEAADIAYQHALALDPNDRMSALACAVDAALTAEVERVRAETIEAAAKVAEQFAEPNGHPRTEFDRGYENSAAKIARRLRALAVEGAG